MTALLASPATPPVIDDRGSHAVERQGDRMIVRNVELFSTKAKDSALGPVDRPMLERIASHTNFMAARGRHTHIVVRHASKEEPADQQSHGTVRALRVGESDGQTYIYGDLHMKPWSGHLLESYPRRSAEIFGQRDGETVSLSSADDLDLWMGNLALLGRETPGADIPDIELPGDGGPEPVAFQSDVPPVTFADQEKPPMELDKKAVIKYLDEHEDERKSIMAKYADEDKGGKDKDEDEKSESKSASGAEPAVPETPAPASFADSAEYLAMAAKIGELEQNQRQSETESALRELADKGVVFDMGDEVERCAKIIDPSDRAAEFARMEKNYARTQTPKSLINAGNAAATFAGDAVPATNQAVTHSDANKVSELAAKFRSDEPALSVEEAIFRATKELELEDKFKATRG